MGLLLDSRPYLSRAAEQACNLLYSLYYSHLSSIAIAMDDIGEKVEIFNQVAETLKVRDLATLIAGKTGVEIRNLENPRKEDAENELQVRID